MANVRRARPILCLMVAGVGVLTACFPAISVWRTGGQALAQLPALPVPTDDVRHPLAVWDPNLVVATRTLSEISTAEVESALLRDGYQPTQARGGQWWSKACCGEDDAVWIQLEAGPGNTTVARVTVADADAGSSWPFIVAVGAGLAVGGAFTAAPRRRPPAGEPADPVISPPDPDLAAIR